MNRLQTWEEEHRQSILQELEEAGIKFSAENIDLIIEETSFRVRSVKHRKKCPYYYEKDPPESCYPSIQDLNCFLCACPNYASEKLDGGCRINSRFGKMKHHPNLPAGRVWDCSDCPVNHTPREVKDYLRRYLAE
jgi:Zn-finger protein